MIVHPNFKKYVALSSVYGKIDQILLLYPCDKENVTPDLIQARFGPLFKGLGDRVTYVFLALTSQPPGSTEWLQVQQKTVESFQEALENAHLSTGKHIVSIFAPLAENSPADKYSSWAQDAFFVAKRNGISILIEPYEGQNREMENLAEQVAAVADAFIKPSWLKFDGGNILVGNDYALIGKNDLERNRRAFFPDDPEAEAKITSEFCRLLGVQYIIWIGDDIPLDLGINLNTGEEDLQPFFHIDLFLTLGGLHKSGKEIILVADLQLDDYHLKGKWKPYADSLNRLNQWLKDLKDELTTRHTRFPGPEFEVITIPIGLERVQVRDVSKLKYPEDSYRWIPYSWNNSLIEDYRGVKRIYFPEYEGWNPLKEMFLRKIDGIFTASREVSFEFNDFASDGGALHCLVKVLNRTHY